MSVQIVLDRNSVWQRIDKSEYDVPESEERLMLMISNMLIGVLISSSVSISDTFTLITNQSDTGTLIHTLGHIWNSIDDGEWLVKNEPAKIPEIEELASITGYTYEWTLNRCEQWKRNNPGVPIKSFILQEKRRNAFHSLCVALNNIDRNHGGLFDCGALGYCQMYISGNKWECRWFEEIEKIEDLED